jgi:hypothetical protein
MGFVFFDVLRGAKVFLVCYGDWSSYENRDILGDCVVYLCPVQLLYVLNNILVCI